MFCKNQNSLLVNYHQNEFYLLKKIYVEGGMLV